MKQNDVKTVQSTAVKKVTSCFQGLQLLVVQSTVCILVLLIVLLLRVIGGDVFETVSAQFQKSMLDHSLLSVISYAFEEKTVSAQTTEGSSEIPAPKAVQSNAAETTVSAPLVGGVLTSHYGEREDPFDTSVTATHQGVDIAAAEGTALAALMDGTVIDVGYEEKGYGHYILVECENNYRFLYAHCSAVNAVVGQRVEAGEIIALVGNTGRSTGSHVHVEWRENNVPIDPMTVLPEQTYA